MLENCFSIEAPPPPAGWLEIGPGVSVSMLKRPLWFHRVMMRLFFGFKWHEATETEGAPDPAQAVGEQ